jgi:hypothetical protein
MMIGCRSRMTQRATSCVPVTKRGTFKLCSINDRSLVAKTESQFTDTNHSALIQASALCKHVQYHMAVAEGDALKPLPHHAFKPLRRSKTPHSK